MAYKYRFPAVAAAIASFLAAAAPEIAFAQGNSATASASSGTTIAIPIGITKNPSLDLRFGSITKSTIAGTNTIKIDSLNYCNRTIVAGGTGDTQLIGSSTGCVRFIVSGQPGQAFTVTVPSPGAVNLTNGSTNLPITFNHWPYTAGALVLDGSGQNYLFVGGEFPVTDTATTGAYTASFNVTVAYQ